MARRRTEQGRGNPLLLAAGLLALVGVASMAAIVVRFVAERDGAGDDSVPLEQWPVVTDSYLQAMRDGDHARAYDHVCHIPNLNPATREEFVAHHRDSLRPTGWQLRWERHGDLHGDVAFADGRTAELRFAVYDGDDPGVCFVASADGWAREALDAKPPSARRPWE